MAEKNTRQELENEVLEYLYKMKDSETQPFINASDPEFMQVMYQFWGKVWEQGSSMPDIIEQIRNPERPPESIIPILRNIFIAGATVAYMTDYLRVNKQFAKDPEAEARIKTKIEAIMQKLNKNATEQSETGTDANADQVPEHLRADQKAAALLKPKK